MSKADDLRKKMSNRASAPTFTPRPSVTIQPLTPTDEKPVPPVTKSKKTIPKASTPKLAVSKPVASSEEDVTPIYGKVPTADKRWLDHYRIDNGRDLSEAMSDAIQALKKKVGNG